MASTILTHRYPNGLVLLAETMPWLRSAAFALHVPAGTAYDPADRVGLSGLVCDMSLRGAGDRDSRQFITDLDNLGVDTDEGVSDVHLSFAGAALAENLPKVIAIFADVVRRPHLPAEELEHSRHGLLQEIRGIEDEPARKVMVELRRRHYPEPWGRPPQGERAGLEAATLDDVHRYFQGHFRPGGTVLAAAGRVDWPRLVDTVGELFGDWAAAEADLPATLPADARYVHLPHDSGQTHIAIAYDTVPYNHPDYLRAWGAVRVLSGGMSARLFTEVRERRGLCYSVHASYHSLKDRAAIICHASSSADRAQETLDVTLGELTRLSKGVSADELRRVKAHAKSALIMEQESSSSRAGSIAADWYHLGRVQTLDELGRRVDELSAEAINAYLADHPPRRFTVVTLGPKALEVPVAVS